MASITFRGPPARPLAHCGDPILMVWVEPAPAPGDPDLLVVEGSLCSATVPVVRDLVLDWHRVATGALTHVDLGGVDFIDGRGIALLQALRSRDLLARRPHRIVDASSRVRALFAVCDIDVDDEASGREQIGLTA